MWSLLYKQVRFRKNRAIPYASEDEKRQILFELKNQPGDPYFPDLPKMLEGMFQVYEGVLPTKHLNALENHYKEDIVPRFRNFVGDETPKRILQLANVGIWFWFHLLWRAKEYNPPKLSFLNENVVGSWTGGNGRRLQVQPQVTILYCNNTHSPKLIENIEMLVKQTETNIKTRPWESRLIPYEVDDCASAIIEILRNGDETLGRYVMLLSPWLKELPKRFLNSVTDIFDSSTGRLGVGLDSENLDPVVIGFPVIDAEGLFSIPTYKIRKQFWKIQWKKQATSQTKFTKLIIGDTTSGTRLIDVKQIQQTLRDPKLGLVLLSLRKWKSFFTEFDLIAVKKNWTIATMFKTRSNKLLSIKETHYLQKSTWTKSQAHHYEAELVNFLCIPNVLEVCVLKLYLKCVCVCVCVCVC